MDANGVSLDDNVDRPAAADAEVVVRTFLIADVRGYTRYTHAHGDEEAGNLATSFAALAREAVTATGGEVIELRGDEALCAFRTARQPAEPPSCACRRRSLVPEQDLLGAIRARRGSNRR
jgi:class 3 adenylate cyclase